ncbi:MAG: CoA-binding protein [Clostridia bacterium]
MTLKEIMDKKSFAILGDTVNPEKYAYKIKEAMLEKGYKVFCVGKELSSLNDIEESVDVVDLCINPIKALGLLKECEKQINFVVIQPGAESDEIFSYLDEKKIPFVQGCLLMGLRTYRQ